MLAIGRGGQNRRLASKLSGFEIEVIKESEYKKIIESQLDDEDEDDFDEEQEEKVVDKPEKSEIPGELESLDGLSPSIIKKLATAGLTSIEDISEKGLDGLKKVSGIGEKTAEKIMSLVNDN